MENKKSQGGKKVVNKMLIISVNPDEKEIIFQTQVKEFTGGRKFINLPKIIANSIDIAKDENILISVEKMSSEKMDEKQVIPVTVKEFVGGKKFVNIPKIDSMDIKKNENVRISIKKVEDIQPNI